MSQEDLLEAPHKTAKTFVERIRNKNSSAAHLVRTYDQEEKACWFLLKANERSLYELEDTDYDDIIDLTQFGEVIASGWGHAPDELALKEFYNSNK